MVYGLQSCDSYDRAEPRFQCDLGWPLCYKAQIALIAGALLRPALFLWALLTFGFHLLKPPDRLKLFGFSVRLSSDTTEAIHKPGHNNYGSNDNRSNNSVYIYHLLIPVK
ncbi:MAG: hypothetical protein LUD69_04755 [Oscillospiraceae bacterium]|nr:hypothetical protein [Oscillospiraceae bacterium]